MSEFKAITTQEEFDSMVKERLDRQAKKTAEEVKKSFEGWLSPDDVKAKTAELEKALAEKDGKLTESKAAFDKLTAEKKALELDRAKESAARDAGLPYELAGRLTGTTPDELKADAEALSKLVSGKQSEPYVQPLFQAGQPSAASTTDAAYMAMLNELSD